MKKSIRDGSLNVQQLATQAAVSRSTISAWVAKGCPHIRTPSGGYAFTLSEVEAWRMATFPQPTTAPSNFVDARTRKETALAELRELQLLERRGKLVLRSAVRDTVFAMTRRSRDRMLNIPARLSGPLAAETDPHTIFVLLTKEIHQALEDLGHGKDFDNA